MDYQSKQILGSILSNWRSQGTAILLVTHDIEFIAEFADRVALLENGEISSIGEPAKLLRNFEDFTPQIAQLFPDTDWLTPKDVITCLK